MTTYDFGYGPVAAHQHTNGGGWVADTATVAATAYVGPDATVSGSARVYGDAWVSGSAEVSSNARVYGDATVSGSARVYGDATVSGSARVYGDARVYGSAEVSSNARVSGSASRTPLYLQLGGYPVTICDDVITIGCTTDTLHGWRTKQDLTRDPETARYLDLIAAIAERHQQAT